MKVILHKASVHLEDVEPQKTIDVKGQICPYPSFETLKALRSMNSGEVLDVVTDYEPTAFKSLPVVCERHGHEFIIIEKEGYWVVRIRKSSV